MVEYRWYDMVLEYVPMVHVYVPWYTRVPWYVYCNTMHDSMGYSVPFGCSTLVRTRVRTHVRTMVRTYATGGSTSPWTPYGGPRGPPRRRLPDPVVLQGTVTPRRRAQGVMQALVRIQAYIHARKHCSGDSAR